MPLAKAPLPKQKVVLPDYLECVLEGRDRVGRQHHIGKRALGRDRLDQPPRRWATEQEIPDRLGHVRSTPRPGLPVPPSTASSAEKLGNRDSGRDRHGEADNRHGEACPPPSPRPT